MRLLAWIGVGSAIGGILRYLLSVALQQRAGSAFPVGTLVVNISGSLALGFLVRYAVGTPAISAELRAFLTIGLCGGYTTFSTYSFETATLIEDGDYRRAAGYAVVSVAAALAGTFLGFAGARALLDAQRQG